MKVLSFPSPAIPDWQTALGYFLLYKRGEGISARTLKDYEKHVSQFFSRFPCDIQCTKLHESVFTYLAEPVAPATYNLRLVYLRGFFRWCMDEHYLSDDPTRRLKRRKAPARIVQLDLDTLKKLLKMPDRATYAGARDYALLLLSLDNGIRPGEALSLLVGDINLTGYQVTIRAENAKTRVPRALPISQSTVQAISDLIRSRHPGWSQDVPLFCSASGRHLGEEWSRRVTRYGKEIGVTLRAYDLRHSFALQFLRGGADAFSLQRILGHADMAMTKRYLALSENDILRTHQSFSPLRFLTPEARRIRKIK